MRRSVLFPILAAFVGTACGVSPMKDSGEARLESVMKSEVGVADGAANSPAAEQFRAVAGTVERADVGAERDGGSGFALPGSSVAALPVDAMLIRTGNASIEVS